MIGAALDRPRRGARSVRDEALGAGRLRSLRGLRAWEGGAPDASLTVVVVPDPPNVIEHHLSQLETIGRDAKVLALELPGFGRSTVPAGFDFAIPSYADRMAGVLEEHTEGPLVLVFTCLGGLVALELAAKLDRVAGLVLSQTPSLADAKAWSRRVDPGGLVGTPIVGQLLIRMSRRGLARTWYEAALPRGADAEPWVRTALDAYEAGADYCLASALQALRATERTARTPVAATVLWGAADRSHRPSDPDRLRDAVPALRVRRLEGVGHFPDLEAPEVLGAELRVLYERIGR